MSQQSEFGERLRLAMVRAGYEPQAAVLEREFNIRYPGRSVSYQGAWRWFEGKAIPTQDKLLVLAQWLKVEPDELRYGVSLGVGGSGSGLKTGESTPGYRADSQQVRALVDDLMSLPVDRQRVLRQLVDFFLQDQCPGSGTVPSPR